MSLTIPVSYDESRPGRELILLEQVHTALGAACDLDEFYTIVASLLVDRNTFGFSRAFLLRYDPRTRTFAGRLALGARSPGEHSAFRLSLDEENRRLQYLAEEAGLEESDDPRMLRSIHSLRYHSLWIRLLQGQEEGSGMNADFQSVRLREEDLPAGHLVEQAIRGSTAVAVTGQEALQGLEPYVSAPAVAGRLMTRRGLHAVLLCDQAFEPHPLDGDGLYHFQWFLNHVAVALENVELVSQLTETTRRLQEVDRMKTNFLSIVSHELRTPLTSIIGFVHLLAEEKVGPVNPAQADLLQRVSGHAGHLHSMVNDLLEIAEVEAGGMINVVLRPVDPLEALLHVMPKVEGRRGQRCTEISPDVKTRPPLIRCDQTALERIYFHLLDNAAKFTPSDGQIRVTFREQDSLLYISIIDTGIGISEANLKRIFDHFYQVDSRLERMYGGMGIGLAVVKLLLEATGGAIQVESTPGTGSRFTLAYPLAEPAG